MIGALILGAVSPALAALAVQLGVTLPFTQASALLAQATGTVVSEATIRRLTEAAGVSRGEWDARWWQWAVR